MTSSHDASDDRTPTGSSAATGHDDGPERDICVVRPAMFRAHPLRYLLILLILGGGIALAVMSLVKRPEDASFQPWMLYPGLLLMLGAVLWWIQWWLAADGARKKVSIANKRTIRPCRHHPFRYSD